MTNSIIYSCEQTFGRYELYLPCYTCTCEKNINTKAMLGHAMFWHGQKTHKVCVQTNSKKLINQNEAYASFHLALAVICGQNPKLVKSRQNISGFKMMINAPLGASVYLRRKHRIWFCYKWTFLSADSALYNPSKSCSSLGVKNLFAFELDALDYDAFEIIPGCDIQFDFKT